MNRLDTIIELDTAITKLEKVREQLVDMCCTYDLDSRIFVMLSKLETLRLDVLQADLPGESD